MKAQLSDTSDNPRIAYTRLEAAAVLGISPISIDRLKNRGLLRPSKALRRPLYPVKEIERFLKDTSKQIG